MTDETKETAGSGEEGEESLSSRQQQIVLPIC